MTSIWRTLGVDPQASRAEIKRAYATRLKSCRPDEDPAGFQRLREAYESALGALGRRDAGAPAAHATAAEQEPAAPWPAGSVDTQAVPTTTAYDPRTHEDAERLMEMVGKEHPKIVAAKLDTLMEAERYAALRSRTQLEAELVERATALEPPPFRFIETLQRIFRWDERSPPDPDVEQCVRYLRIRHHARREREQFERQLPRDPSKQRIGRLLLGQRSTLPESWLARSRANLRAFVTVTHELAARCPSIFDYEFDGEALERWLAWTNSARLTFDDVAAVLIVALATVPVVALCTAQFAAPALLLTPPHTAAWWLIAISLVVTAAACRHIGRRPRTAQDHVSYPSITQSGLFVLFLAGAFVPGGIVIPLFKAVLPPPAYEAWSYSTWPFAYWPLVMIAAMLIFVFAGVCFVRGFRHAAAPLRTRFGADVDRFMPDVVPLAAVGMLVVLDHAVEPFPAFIGAIGIALIAAFAYGGHAFLLVSLAGLLATGPYVRATVGPGLGDTAFEAAWVLCTGGVYVTLVTSLLLARLAWQRLTRGRDTPIDVDKLSRRVSSTLLILAVLSFIYWIATTPPV